MRAKLSTSLTSVGAVLSFLILAFSTSLGWAQERCSAVFVNESWLITARVSKNQFVTNRGLYEYQQELPRDFSQSLRKLRADQRWVDLGAGKAKAQIEYLKSFNKETDAPHAIAVAFKLDRWFSPPKFNGKLSVKEGAFELQPTSQWPKADLVTDVFGVISYTPDLQTTLQKVFDLMNVRGELYILATPYATSFQSTAGSQSLIEFLSTIDGLQVDGQYGTIKVTKLQELVQVPRLELTEFKDDAPPYRSFKVH